MKKNPNPNPEQIQRRKMKFKRKSIKKYIIKKPKQTKLFDHDQVNETIKQKANRETSRSSILKQLKFKKSDKKKIKQTRKICKLSDGTEIDE